MNREWYRYNLDKHKYQRIDKEDIELNDIICCRIPAINGVSGFIVQDDEEVVVVTKLDNNGNIVKITGLKKVLSWIRLIKQRFSINLLPSEIFDYSLVKDELNYPDEDLIEVNWASLELRNTARDWISKVEEDYPILYKHEI